MSASAHLARKAIYVVGAKRTPFGAFGGKLKGFSATELAYLASKAALTQAKVDPKASHVVHRIVPTRPVDSVPVCVCMYCGLYAGILGCCVALRRPTCSPTTSTTSSRGGGAREVMLVHFHPD